ncbi:MAG: YeeE/YedE family protein [Candidatus Mcinerneyibacterium aminivorans]|uniref:YeeE/YedE family protein n=1 Tax=Candidatus Mcinerneyibacterium aminivorans TaxID=2703815 RepID=A0A5D0MKM4_9BACT|nr:MAG: YeeE/YedE family protein [Candidatus Mcinerneyibacterium aminivorans]
MLTKLHSKSKLQLFLALLAGILFGFFLQKGGVSNYNIILGQLLLTDFTVIKIILTAIVVGMIGIYGMKSLGLVELHPKSGSFGKSVVGGLIFGLGFATLGYCPGTISAAVGQGNLDALIGGIIGIIIGAAIFAQWYPKLNKKFLHLGDFGDIRFPGLLKVNAWIVIIPLSVIIIGFLYWLESAGY